MRAFGGSIRIFAVFSLICGIIYPLMVTALGRFLFQEKAAGSLVYFNGGILGSELVGQEFTSAANFHGRPSNSDYEAFPSSASNLGPTSAALEKEVAARRRRLMAEGQLSGPLPPELLLSSGSGLDPDITPAAALFQVDRIARARGLSPRQREAVLVLIRRLTTGPSMGILGTSRINVLELNRALDRIVP
jgi:K+-transporting ATPase ATPase C chain